MKGLNGFYIITKEGALLFSYESFDQGGGDWNIALLSTFISAMQGIARELGRDSTKIIEIGNKRLYTSKDIEFGIIFIIRANLKAKEKKVVELMSEFKDKFLKKYTNFLLIELQKEREIEFGEFNEFKEELAQLIPSKSAVQAFIKSI